MVTSSTSLLWEKIENFDFDRPGAAITFASKLAEQNRWSDAFAAAVIEEYKRFLYLCSVAPAGASPSYAVDKAWHLHLTYTQSYWTDLCKNTLGRELHHFPATGDEDKTKYQKWYEETLSLYESVFKRTPNPEIWPKHQPTEDMVVPDFAAGIGLRNEALIFVCSLTVFAVLDYTLHLSSARQTDKFELYFGLSCFIVAVILYFNFHKREGQIKSFLNKYFPANANVYEVAMFIGEKDRAVQTAIVDLLLQKQMTLDDDRMFTVTGAEQPLGSINPIRKHLALTAPGAKVSYQEIDKEWARIENFVHPVLGKMKNAIVKPSPPFGASFFFIILLGFAKAVISHMNDQAERTIGVELFCLFVFLLPLQVIYGREQIMKLEVKRLFRNQLAQFNAATGGVLIDFALEGSSSIENLKGGALLASIFQQRSSAEPPASSCGGG